MQAGVRPEHTAVTGVWITILSRRAPVGASHTSPRPLTHAREPGRMRM